MEYSAGMKIVRAQSLGFCSGVRRALKLALEAAEKGPPVYMLGELVHNGRVSARLRALGAEILDESSIEGIEKGALVIIRSHGAAPDLIARLERAEARIIDATCPKVRANQKAAAAYAEEGYTVVVAGDRGHGEALGVAAHAPGSIIVSNQDEADALDLRGDAALIAQTTLSQREYAAIRASLLRKNPSLKEHGGICAATADRQDALAELCSQVDAIVVIGGANSANSRRLAELAWAGGKPCWIVEDPKDLPEEAASYERVGLTAGASTPDEDIDEAEGILERWSLRRGRE
jgi:4-hydroxy-3-methylbut-2-enyl diphosphate reductase